MSLTAASTLLLAACAGSLQPSLDEVQTRTIAAMQRIADEVPGGVVEVRTAETPYLACGGDSYNYIARWAVSPAPGFDGQAFVDALPGRLGDAFSIAETVPISVPAVALDHVDGVVLDVTVLPVDGAEVVDIYGISAGGAGSPDA